MRVSEKKIMQVLPSLRHIRPQVVPGILVPLTAYVKNASGSSPELNTF